MTQIITLIVSAITFGTIIMFGAIGEIITEKSGQLNLGVPGIMFMGAIASLVGGFMYEKNTPEDQISPVLLIVIPLVCAFVASALGGLIYAFLTITLRANQNVTGLTLTIFGAGIANFFGASLNTLTGGVGQVRAELTSKMFKANLLPVWNRITGGHAGNVDAAATASQTGAKTIGVFDIIGDLVFSYGWLVYVAVIVAIISQYFLTKTRKGLNLRAVGESPATADAAGINVTLYKYLATCIGGGICGLGGLFYVMDYTNGTWANDGTIENLGWLAVALVIFTIWKPKNSIWGGYLFGLLFWLWLYIPGLTRASQELFKMLPYVVTTIVLIVISLRKKRENQPPASLGLPYFREDR